MSYFSTINIIKQINNKNYYLMTRTQETARKLITSMSPEKFNSLLDSHPELLNLTLQVLDDIGLILELFSFCKEPEHWEKIDDVAPKHLKMYVFNQRLETIETFGELQKVFNGTTEDYLKEKVLDRMEKFVS